MAVALWLARFACRPAAATGTGKSFGALVPALVMAKSRQKRLVVSSSTVALQHQYAEKDAPSLQRLVPIPFTFAVAKGRRRYACTAKLQAEGKLAGQGGLDLAGERGPGGAEDAPRRVAVMRELLASFDAGRWSGDRDELPLPVVDEVWDRVTTDRQGCAGSECPEFARCPFQAARQRVKEADLVIANHDLVLSAIDMDGASVLPPPQETIYVFDEAHSLAAKAVEHFSARHALRGAIDWLEGACNAVRDAVLGLRLDEQLIRDSRTSAERIERALRDLHQRIHGTNGFEETLGTLVLFTSARQMREVYAQLPEDLRRVTLVQGSMPKGEMLARHRAAVDRADRSVLFGLSTFAEGVDLPGEYCTHVVIAKLPFSVPDSPLEEARREWVESRGGSLFIEITVPEAAVRLKQGLGRLLRTIHDRGRVTILDRRIVTKRWGGLLMRGMPDFEIVIERCRAARPTAARTEDLKEPSPAGP